MPDRLNGPMVERLRRCAADTSPNWDGAITVYPPEARLLVRLIGAVATEPSPSAVGGAEGPPEKDVQALAPTEPPAELEPPSVAPTAVGVSPVPDTTPPPADLAGWVFEDAQAKHALSHGAKERFCCTKAGLAAARPYLVAAELDRAEERIEWFVLETQPGGVTVHGPLLDADDQAAGEEWARSYAADLRADGRKVQVHRRVTHILVGDMEPADEPAGLFPGTGTPREQNDHGVRYDEITVGRWVRLDGGDHPDESVTALVTRMDTPTFGRVRVYPEHQQGEPYDVLFHADNVLALVNEPGTGTPQQEVDHG